MTWHSLRYPVLVPHPGPQMVILVSQARCSSRTRISLRTDFASDIDEAAFINNVIPWANTIGTVKSSEAEPNILPPSCQVAQPTSCALATDVAGEISPLASSLAGQPDSFECGAGTGTEREKVFFMDVQSGFVFWARLRWANFDTLKTLRWGGDCPGDNFVACRDHPNVGDRYLWVNDEPTPERVFFVVDSDTTGTEFTFEWELREHTTNGTCNHASSDCFSFSPMADVYPFQNCRQSAPFLLHRNCVGIIGHAFKQRKTRKREFRSTVGKQVSCVVNLRKRPVAREEWLY